MAADIICDVRGDRLRFGFGLHQTESDIAAAIPKLAAILRELRM